MHRKKVELDPSYVPGNNGHDLKDSGHLQEMSKDR